MEKEPMKNRLLSPRNILTVLFALFGLYQIVDVFIWSKNKTDAASAISNTKNFKTAEKLLKSMVVSKTQFIYTDTLRGFQIIVKESFNYSTTDPTVQFMAINSNSKKSIVFYAAEKINSTKVYTQGQFFNELQKAKPEYHISNVRSLDYKNGYRIEEGIFVVKKDDGSKFGKIRVYLKDKMCYSVFTLFGSELEFKQNDNLTKEIFDSFNILE